jgi:signal transduction histidine kinase
VRVSAPLFLRIFVGFWLVTVGVLGTAMLAGNYLDTLLPEASDLEEGDRHPSGARGPGVPPRIFVRLLYELQTVPLENIPELIIQAQKKHGVDVFLLRASGEDFLQRPVPPSVARVAARLGGDRRRIFQRHGPEQFLGHQIYRTDIGSLRSVLVVHPPKIPLINALGSNLWLRATLAVVVSGLLCFALSRLLTRRLSRLRQAARTLAEGNLEARLSVRAQGGDETDDLARDFNRMAEQLEARIGAQKQLLSDVSHELRSPLARLHVAVALAAKHPEKAAEQLQRIEREIRRLDSLVGELLASQSEHADLEQHIDIVALLQELCADARFEMGARRRITLHNSLHDALVADNGGQLRKAFDNVLRNACYYSPEGSEITVTIAAVGNHFNVVIADRGPGVPEQDLEKIFDPFYRVDDARARHTGGYGLGLSIARQALRLQGGSIIAANTRPGLAMQISVPAFKEDAGSLSLQ